MPKYDTTFKEMETFTMQPQWLAVSDGYPDATGPSVKTMDGY